MYICLQSFSLCSPGRVMYVIPYSMGPLGSSLSKVGVQLTDFNYVVLSMRVMARVSTKIYDIIKKGGDFVKCVHSIGSPRPINSKCKMSLKRIHTCCLLNAIDVNMDLYILSAKFVLFI